MAAKKFKVGNVPNRRFPGFEGAWEVTTLENICDRIGDGIHSTPMYDEFGDYYFINGNNFIDGKIVISESTKKVTKREAAKHNIKSLSANAILLSINGTIGNIALYRDELVMLGKSACFLNPKLTVSRLFVFHSLRSKRVVNYYLSEVTGTTIKNLSLKSIRATHLLLPNIDEQDKIASFLSLIDERIDTQNKIIEELQTLMQSLADKLFSRKITFKKAGKNTFPEWDETKMESVFEFKVTNSFSREKLNYSEGIIKNIHYGDIHTKYRTLFNIEKEHTPYINLDVNTNGISKESYCQIGDLILADASENLKDVGKSIEVVNLKSQKTLSGLHTILARPLKNVFTVGFCGYLFRSEKVRLQIQKEAQGSKVLSISSARLSNLTLPIPPLMEQTLIVDFLSLIDEKIEVEKVLLRKYDFQKQYLLQNIFI